MTVSKEKADYIIEFDIRVFSDAVSKVRRFIGSKPGPVTVEAITKKKKTVLRFTQASPMATAIIDVSVGFTINTKEKQPFFMCVPDDWLVSVSKISEKLTILKSGSDITLRAGRRYTTTREVDAPPEMDSEGSGESQAVMMNQFVKPGRKILGMKSFFTDRPCAATYGEEGNTIFFMVNDQYHGIAITTENKSARGSILLTTNAAAFKPILDSEDTAEHHCTVEDGRLVIMSQAARYWMPVFDPAAAPTKDEVLHVVSVKAKNYIVLSTKELTDAARMVARGQDESQVFNIKFDGEKLNIEYNSATSSAGAEITATKVKSGKWKSFSMDPNLFADIVTKMESDRVRMWVTDNMFFLSESSTEMPKIGFAILMVEND